MIWSKSNHQACGEEMNNYIALMVILCCFLQSITVASDNFNIVVKPKWRHLDNDDKKIIDFGGKWVLVGSITFKKRCKDPIFLETINLRWNGEPIPNLVASLYKKTFSKDFLPIEKNLICDSVWNTTKQMLVFNFNEKETLAPTTTFYLVLTIPQSVEA